MKKIAMFLLAALAVTSVCYAAPAPKKAKKGKKVTLTIDFSTKPFKEISSNYKKVIVTPEGGQVFTFVAPNEKEYPIEIINEKGGFFYGKIGDNVGLMVNYSVDRSLAAIKTPVIKGKTLKKVEFTLLNGPKKDVAVSSAPDAKGDQVRREEYEGNVEQSVTLANPEPEKPYYIVTRGRNTTFGSLTLIYE